MNKANRPTDLQGTCVLTDWSLEGLRRSETAAAAVTWSPKIQEPSVTAIVSMTLLQSEPGRRAQFMELAETWRRTRGVSSRVKDLTQNDAYEAIIGMGWDAIPFILEDLDRAPDHWFPALEKITGADPVREDSRGILRLMADDWINWALESGHYRR